MITVVHAATAEVATEPIAADQVRSGAPEAGTLDLTGPAGLEVGIWVHSPGTSTDVEADELFVVLAGRATIEPDGGAPVEVGPGDVVHLVAGTATTWTVHETLRKVYVLPA